MAPLKKGLRLKVGVQILTRGKSDLRIFFIGQNVKNCLIDLLSN
jgi:hypothetical protein